MLMENEFDNCSLGRGSVIVRFQVIQKNEDSETTLSRLNTFVANNIFTLHRPDGTKLNTVPSSVYVDGKHEIESGKVVPYKEASSSHSVFAIGILLFLIICGFILLLFLLYVLCRKDNKRKVTNTLCRYKTLLKLLQWSPCKPGNVVIANN